MLHSDVDVPELRVPTNEILHSFVVYPGRQRTLQPNKTTVIRQVKHLLEIVNVPGPAPIEEGEGEAAALCNHTRPRCYPGSAFNVHSLPPTRNLLLTTPSNLAQTTQDPTGFQHKRLQNNISPTITTPISGLPTIAKQFQRPPEPPNLYGPHQPPTPLSTELLREVHLFHVLRPLSHALAMLQMPRAQHHRPRILHQLRTRIL